MPLVRISLARGSSPAYRRALADGVHKALVEKAAVPADDRFQVIEELEPENLVADPRYLGHERSSAVVFVQVVLNSGRSVEVKQALYAAIAQNLAQDPGLRPDDLLVSLVDVPRENWSFGGGRMSYPPPQG